MYCIEEGTCDIVGTFRFPAVIWRPGNHTDSVPGESFPLVPPRYDPTYSGKEQLNATLRWWESSDNLCNLSNDCRVAEYELV